MTFANVVSCLALFVALGGTSYAALTITGKHVKNSSLTGKDVKNNSLTSSDVKNLTARDFRPGQLPAGPTGPAGPAGAPGPKGDAGAKGDPAPAGVLDASFVYGNPPGKLPATTPQNSQLNFASTDDPEKSGGLITIDRPGQIHAEAAVEMTAPPGYDAAAMCDLRMAGKSISSEFVVTFSDAGLDAEGNPAHAAETLPLVGSALVEPGTYNVGVRCHADRADTVDLSVIELHAVVYAK